MHTCSSLHLYRYPSEREASRRPNKVVPLCGCVVRSEPKLTTNNVHAFSIINENGVTVLELATRSADSARDWMDSILDVSGSGNMYYHTPATINERIGTILRSSESNLISTNHLSASGINSVLRNRRNMNFRGADLSGARTRRDDDLQPQMKQKDMKNAGDSEKIDPDNFDMPASMKVHRRSIYSILSSERLSYQRHDGLVNLGTVIILATNFRLILENLLKYGLRVHPLAWLLPVAYKTTSPEAVARTRVLLLAWPALFLITVFSFLLELAAMRHAASRAAMGIAAGVTMTGCLLFFLSFINVLSSLLVPSYLIHATTAEPLAGFALIMVAVVIFLKLWSYAHANMDLRSNWQARMAVRAQGKSHQHQPKVNDGQQPSSSENSENFAMSESEIDDSIGSVDGDVSSGDERISYPDNLVVGNFTYFLMAPTLCYQMSYPRNPKVRVSWLFRRIAEMFIYLSLMIFLIEQYITPSVNNSVESLASVNRLVLSGSASQKTARALVVLLERVLKLSIPTLYVWLCAFYCLFHLWLNILAELTRFGDRQFYKDWWNASTIDQYWRLWNMPVHKWLVRHIYFPALRLGMGKNGATFIVFLFSAVFHELLVGLPLHVFRSWAFMGIMLQLPLISVTRFVKDKFKSDQVFNSFNSNVFSDCLIH